MIILGISCYYHDAAAVIIRDGKIIAAAEEERFSRKKHDSNFPKNAIDFCLKEAGITTKKLDYVILYEKPFRKLQRILFTTLSFYPWAHAAFREGMRLWLNQKLWVKQDIASYLDIDHSKILFNEHHLSHAASAFYPSPFKSAAILTIDGVGEWATTTWGVGKGNKIMINKEIRFPHSLGLLYSAFTAFLGFEVNEGEWKVMGLAPYGKPRYVDKVWKVVKLHNDGSFTLDLSYFSFHYSDTTSYSEKLIELFGLPIDRKESHLVTKKAADIAASIQVVTEEILLAMTKKLRQETGEKNLCIAGGVALNSVANFRILKESGFKSIFVQPAAGDSGGALGAALYVYHQILNNKKRYPQNHAYFGKEYSNEEIEKFLKSQKLFLERSEMSFTNSQQFSLRSNNTVSRIQYTRMFTSKLIDYIADKIKTGKVVGWMQGKFEWGPRALGNRSILADARNPKMKDIINSKVKFREAFRPFAPSALLEKGDMVFDLPNNYKTEHPLRYMLYVVPVKKDWRKKVPAINHADNTARPQLVDKKVNPLYHKLISVFYKKTGVPLILNTSFNLRGEPIVMSPQDAYSTFVRSGIDILVMGNYVCEK